ncbi:unnamed protein product [Acidithrix sp. C25]|nr:unnamed protein product [Acidithrix sp. C25]
MIDRAQFVPLIRHFIDANCKSDVVEYTSRIRPATFFTGKSPWAF